MKKSEMDHIISDHGLDKLESSFDIMKRFSENIAALRVQSGYTQDDVSYMIGVSKPTYVRIELGMTSSVNSIIAIKLSALYKVPMMLLFGYGDDTIRSSRDLWQAAPRTQRLVQSILDAEKDARRNLPAYDPDDMITLLQFSEQIHDGISANRFLHSQYNISYFKSYKWYKNSDVLLEVNSNYYHPLYHIGDKLVICRRIPRNGEIGIFIKDSSLYIRRVVESPEHTILERVELPTGGDADPMIINRRNVQDMNDYTKFGTVVAVI